MDLQLGCICWIDLFDCYVGFKCCVSILDWYFGFRFWTYMSDFTYHDLASIRIQIITPVNNLNCPGDVAPGLLASLALAGGAGILTFLGSVTLKCCILNGLESRGEQGVIFSCFSLRLGPRGELLRRGTRTFIADTVCLLLDT